MIDSYFQEKQKAFLDLYREIFSLGGLLTRILDYLLFQQKIYHHQRQGEQEQQHQKQEGLKFIKEVHYRKQFKEN